MDISKQFSLEGKVALVTGAAYGIGFAIAEGLAAAGAKIAFNCRGEKHMQEALENYKCNGSFGLTYSNDQTGEKGFGAPFQSRTINIHSASPLFFLSI